MTKKFAWDEAAEAKLKEQFLVPGITAREIADAMDLNIDQIKHRARKLRVSKAPPRGQSQFNFFIRGHIYILRSRGRRSSGVC
jgi:hypothetical protein